MKVKVKLTDVFTQVNERTKEFGSPSNNIIVEAELFESDKHHLEQCEHPRKNVNYQFNYFECLDCHKTLPLESNKPNHFIEGLQGIGMEKPKQPQGIYTKSPTTKLISPVFYFWNDKIEARDCTGDKGDYIIQGIKGEIYPCKSDIFEATYEPLL